MPVRRAQGPLAIVADDELCSILVTGTGSNDTGYGYGVELTNNGGEDITVVAQDAATVGGTAVTASLSCDVAPEDTVEGVLTLAYNDSLPDADSFEGASVVATLDVLDVAGNLVASYPVTIG